MSAPPRGLHVAIIMDGNGRWAAQRGLPRLEGHRRGADSVDRVVSAAPDLGIGTLTLYAFSSDNWRRPPEETGGLMKLFARYLERETARCAREGVRLLVIGRRDRLPADVLGAIEAGERATAAGTRLDLRVAIDYSARDLILRASALAGARAPSRESFARLLARAYHAPHPAPDVDLLVRTGGEQRLSDFLLWECAYAELVFSPKLWPDFDENELRGALEEFGRRQRRFGGIAPAPAA